MKKDHPKDGLFSLVTLSTPIYKQIITEILRWEALLEGYAV